MSRAVSPWPLLFTVLAVILLLVGLGLSCGGTIGFLYSRS